MKAWVIHRYGGPENLTLAERPEPEVGPRDVLIDVAAASLNPIDYKLRQGQVRLVVRMTFPVTLGCDVSGRVRSVGREVTRFHPGDEVYARLEKGRMGALAERVAAHESVVCRKPARASFVEAAAVPLAALTSLQALREVARLAPGQRVLVHAGAGGVGTFAIRIAKTMGLWVAATTSTKNVAFVRGLGADEVVDYTQSRIADRLRDLDAVLDTLGDASEIASFSVVKRGGIVVGVSGTPDAAFARASLPWIARPVVWLRGRARDRAAAAAGARFAFLFMRPDGAQLEEIGRWIDEGRVQPILYRTFAFEEAKDAFVELERGRARGKIVVRMAGAEGG